MKKDAMEKKDVKSLLDTRFIRVYDLAYAPGRHYYDATRRDLDSLVAIQNEEEFADLLADAVSAFVTIKTLDQPERLLLFYEYRYPIGRYVLSVPAGLIDPADKQQDEPILSAARREIAEETGLVAGADDQLKLVNPCAFTTPGFTDESNAIVAARFSRNDCSQLNHRGATGTEKFGEFVLCTREQARKLLKDGKDAYGHYYPMITFAALLYFIGMEE